MDYKIIYSSRKTVAIHITKSAEVQVRAPMGSNRAELDKLVAAKSAWIEQHLAEQMKRLEAKSVFSPNYGDRLLLRGSEYPIRAVDGERIGFDGEGFFMPPGLSPDKIKQCAAEIYKLYAKQLFAEKAAVFSEKMKLDPTAVKVSCAGGRWGSCSGKNSINLSWRLVMADDDVIDYVIVHEIAHIREHNHSGKFWAAVESILPDYRQRRDKLGHLQKRLAAEDWD